MRYGYETADCSNYELLRKFSVENRKYPTEAESVLWQFLSGKPYGLHFRRQHIIGPYIVDFVCLKKNIVIEIDGGYHFSDYQQAKDQKRTERLESLGYHVIRFTNEEVLCDIDNTLNYIKDYLTKQ